jgi:hypothetical protein
MAGGKRRDQTLSACHNADSLWATEIVVFLLDQAPCLELESSTDVALYDIAHFYSAGNTLLL